MGISCAKAPSNKQEYIREIGKILVDQYGKKKYYKPKEVKNAHKRSRWDFEMDFSCWAMSTFSSHNDFDNYHDQTGEVCDYVEMKTEMLNGLSTNLSVPDWTDVSGLDIDSSWLDFGDVFEVLLEGIGTFIASIFDGL